MGAASVADEDVGELKKTPLHDVHLEDGARMVSFAGWHMPLQYAQGIRQEHLDVRGDAGVFDVSHMGRLRVSGADCLEFLQHLVPRDVSGLEPGQMAYAVMCADDGGILDDLAIYRRRETECHLVVNASRLSEDIRWIRSRAQGWTGVETLDYTAESSMLALQGPRSEEIAVSLLGPHIGRLRYFRFASAVFEGEQIQVSRSGYTGEDGFEIICNRDSVSALWRAARSMGANPIGLGARDTLRTEMGYCLYGQELDESTTPIEAGLDWTLNLDKTAPFPGKQVLHAAMSQGGRSRLIGLSSEGRAIPRPGSRVMAEQSCVGRVSSGTYSPTLERGIALAFIEPSHQSVGTLLHIEMRGRLWPVRVSSLPFVPPRVKRSKRRRSLRRPLHSVARQGKD